MAISKDTIEMYRIRVTTAIVIQKKLDYKLTKSNLSIK